MLVQEIHGHMVSDLVQGQVTDLIDEGVHLKLILTNRACAGAIELSLHIGFESLGESLRFPTC